MPNLWSECNDGFRSGLIEPDFQSCDQIGTSLTKPTFHVAGVRKKLIINVHIFQVQG